MQSILGHAISVTTSVTYFGHCNGPLHTIMGHRTAMRGTSVRMEGRGGRVEGGKGGGGVGGGVGGAGGEGGGGGKAGRRS